METNNWDLQAVVSGCCSTTTKMEDPFSSFRSSLLVRKDEQDEEAVVMSFPELSMPDSSVYELEELCKPFIVKSPPSLQPPHPQHRKHQQQMVQQKHRHECHQISSSPAAAMAPVTPHRIPQPRVTHRPLLQAPRTKRRRNQQKKVVCQVPVDGVTSDLWAWRKYGQKPIKGSPHPRGYYRCSSSKGCPARKQVERSRDDPGILIITYSAEHNHQIPSHRSSLTGSTRHKLPPSVPSDDDPSTINASLSPTTPVTACMEDKLLTPRNGCSEDEEEGDDGVEMVPLLKVEDMEMVYDLLFIESGSSEHFFPPLQPAGGR